MDHRNRLARALSLAAALMPAMACAPPQAEELEASRPLDGIEGPLFEAVGEHSGSPMERLSRSRHLVVRKNRGMLKRGSREDAEALLEMARREDLRVIVGLRASFHPEGHLGSKEAVASQRKTIALAKDDLIARLVGPGAGVARRLDPLPFMSLDVNEETLAKLLSDPEVETIEEDSLFSPILVDSIPLIGADEAHLQGATGAGGAVAILDTGVELSHPHFSGRIVSEACYSTNNASWNLSSLCPGGATSSTSAGSGDACSSSIYGCSHGTQVAGIAAASGAGIVGAAPEADIVSVKVFSRLDDFVGCNGHNPCVVGQESDWIAGINRVADLRDSIPIQAANMSLGGGRYESNCDSDSPAAKSAIDNLRSLGVATIIATGNDGYTDAIAAPACISTAISVGSTNKQDEISSFSNSASFVHLLAPGEDILSSFLGGGTTTSSGTSLAAPHVAGAWTAVRSLVPDTPIEDVLDAFVDTGVPITDTRGNPPPNTVTPRIQVDEALTAAGGGSVVAPPVMSPEGGVFEHLVDVTISSATQAASIRYTTDGTDPTPNHGIEISNGSTITLDESVELRAIAYQSGADHSTVNSGDYFVRAALRVDIEPADAAEEGARYRQEGLSMETFESGGLDRYDWALAGNGAWEVIPLGLPGMHLARSPTLQHGQSASMEVTIEADGGDVSFVAAVSSAQDQDELCFYVDAQERGCWSGETGWIEPSFGVDAGQRAFRWTYRRGQGEPAGLDLALISSVTFPGDHWRAPGETLSFLWAESDQPSTRIAFDEVEGWITPDDLEMALPAGQTTELTAVYEPLQRVEEPVMSPAGGLFQAEQEVELSTATDEATIHYTLNHEPPSESSPVYSDPIHIAEDSEVTVKARAFRSGWAPSPIAAETYRVTGTVADPVFSVAPGVYTSSLELWITSSTSGATVRCTTTGTEPGPDSPRCPAPMVLEEATDTLVSARAYRDDWIPSNAVSGTFEVTGQVATPTLDPEESLGHINELRVTIETATPDSTIRYTLDGSTPSQSSSTYEEPVILPPGSDVQLCARAFRQGWEPSEHACGSYSVAPRAAAPSLSPQPGFFDEEVLVGLESTEEDSTIRYTLDDTDPTAESPVYEGPIELPWKSSKELRARAFRDGYSDSEVAAGTYHSYPALRLERPTGEELTSKDLERGEELPFLVKGGSGNHSLRLDGLAGATLGSIEQLEEGYIYLAPSTGAFAGLRELVVTDATGATATATLNLDLVVRIIPKEIEGGASARVTIRGGAPGTIFALDLVGVEGNPISKIGQLSAPRAAENDPEAGNPATAGLETEEVDASTAFRVRATHEDTSGLSPAARLLPPGGDGGGCGCRATGDGPEGAMLLLAPLLLVLLRRRLRGGAL